VKGVKQLGFRSGNWLTLDQSTAVLNHACGDTVRAKRDYAMLALLLGCGLRRSELVGLEIREVQTRQGHWAIVDLIGKGRRVRTVPIPQWAKRALDLTGALQSLHQNSRRRRSYLVTPLSGQSGQPGRMAKLSVYTPCPDNPDCPDS
jgi:site-specific recombinase XerC